MLLPLSGPSLTFSRAIDSAQEIKNKFIFLVSVIAQKSEHIQIKQNQEETDS
jgi:DNA-binding protein